MKTLKTIATIVFIGILFNEDSYAQQSTRFSQFNFSPLLINPAAAGNEGNLLTTGFKSMWNGIPGAPRTQFLTIEGHLLHKKIGWGVEVQNDQAALLKQRKVLLSGTYRQRVSEQAWLNFGAAIGPKQHIYDGHLSTFKQNGDPSIPNQRINQIKPAVNLGVYFSNRRWRIGLSGENANQYHINFADGNGQQTARAQARLYATAQYRYPINRDFMLIAGLMYKYEQNNPSQLDITPLLQYNNRFTFGLGYRPSESISGIVQFEIVNGLKVGYAYDYQTNALNSVSNNSHELMLRYGFGNQRSGSKSPRDFYNQKINL